MKSLDERFEIAYAMANAMTEKLPPDVMLKFYAYYKQATKGKNYTEASGDHPLRSAFKLNAWIQLNKLSEEEAKEKYIELVETITKQKIE